MILGRGKNEQESDFRPEPFEMDSVYEDKVVHVDTDKLTDMSTNTFNNISDKFDELVKLPQLSLAHNTSTKKAEVSIEFIYQLITFQKNC